MKRTPLTRSSNLRKRRSRPKARITVGGYLPHDFWLAAQAQGHCAVTKAPAGRKGPWEAHHVIEKQEVGSRGGDRYDPRNALRLNELAHTRHTRAVRRVRLQELRDENIAFAFELMGRAAYVYLNRMYDGTDTRVELAIAELEANDATS